MEQLNILLDGNRVTGYSGETILQVAERNEIRIPTLCHDPRLEPYSSCFVCVVEVVGMKNLQPACSTRITEGMKITTESEKIRQARKSALDLLVSNHYADCVAPCKQTCPAGVDVQGYISLIEKGLYSEAVGLIKEVNPLPAICGRVCVRPCEAACRRNLLDEGAPVGIDYLKRFAADYDLESGHHYTPVIEPSTGKKVAIIGAGPGGLSAAYFLQSKGHQCDIFEANPHAGGWLRYGIPEYRLPNDLLQKEVDTITELGVNIHYGQRLGDNLSYKHISENYDSTILTIGSQRGTLLGCDGEESDGVFSGIDFLRNMEVTGQRYDFSGKTVAVVGGGNTAMDCCRTSIRCKADKVYVIYRRTEKEMPANPIEIHESKLEGVEYMFLTNPVKVEADSNGKVKSITCIQMELGEPDASGRRRPVPVEGSEFTLEVDYIMAAIGQKTDVNFLDDINEHAVNGQLKVNRWGDLDADKDSLATGIPGVFAAGDGVTGPATIIEAIAQAKLASHSCHQFLSGLELTPPEKEFLSKRDNFKEQIPEEYVGRYQRQLRHEMPTLDPSERNNFREVELGYADDTVASQETHRCLECGCAEYFTCDLKRLCTEYGAEQDRFAGEYNEFPVDFAHPYIEIDNNKCILCARCVRVCREVVGASALGLVERGFETFVAPSMGMTLSETYCESCGMCISACPTGAMSEHVPFKPGPVKTSPVVSLCNYCSVGCSLEYNQRSGFIMGVDGHAGTVNPTGNLCKYGRFGYRIINDRNRITKPLLKKDGKFVEIGLSEALEIMKDKMLGVKPDENAFFAGARLTNEEQYLIQKLARAAVGSPAVGSFHYLGRESELRDASFDTLPFDKISDAGEVWLLGSDLNLDNGVVGFKVMNDSWNKGFPVHVITEKVQSAMAHKATSLTKIASYYHFIKAVNHFILTTGLQNQLFLNDRTEGLETYKSKLLKKDYAQLIKASGATQDEIESFAINFNEEQDAVLIFSEKEVTSGTALELRNLALLTGKLGKTSTGIICMKEKNNSQGLFDMGCAPNTSVGAATLTDDVLVKMKAKYGTMKLTNPDINILDSLEASMFKNLFVFGEDPIACAKDPSQVNAWFEAADFVVVEDLFMTETAKLADLILPASMLHEMGGSFTNTQRVIQNLEVIASDSNAIATKIMLLKAFNMNGLLDVHDVFSELSSLLENGEENRYQVRISEYGLHPLFNHGCDYVNLAFDKDFDERFKESITELSTEPIPS